MTYVVVFSDGTSAYCRPDVVFESALDAVKFARGLIRMDDCPWTDAIVKCDDRLIAGVSLTVEGRLTTMVGYP